MNEEIIMDDKEYINNIKNILGSKAKNIEKAKLGSQDISKYEYVKESKKLDTEELSEEEILQVKKENK